MRYPESIANASRDVRDVDIGSARYSSSEKMVPRHHQARDFECETGSNASHEKSTKDKLGLMSEPSQTQKAHPVI